MMAKPTPTAAERQFGIHELFFSTSDRKGLILSGNSVFRRVSGYSGEELLGEPHNIIRHPDMPRAVFQLLWDYIGAGRPIAAYVKNMAKDGAFYWVLATVVPVGDRYLSVRMKPSTPLLATVDGLYAELRAMERKVEAGGGTPKDAIRVSTARLLEVLPQLGFPGYDDFMREALALEMRSREAAISARRANEGGSGTLGSLEALRLACHSLNGLLRGEFEKIDRFGELRQAFVGRSGVMLGLADDIRLFSLNAQIGAARLRELGAALGVIADIMRSRSDATAGLIRAMSEETDALVELLPRLAFHVCIAALQSDMAVQFIDELAEGAEQDDSATDAQDISPNMAALAVSVRKGVAPFLNELERRLERVSTHLTGLRWELRQLEALQVFGRVETARLEEASEFRVLFDEIRAQIGVAKDELRDLATVESVREQLDPEGRNTAIERSLSGIESWAAIV